ncbi:MAG: formylglycine-generating enzyme family protein [Candidatus Poribacteria bacterium]|nr:formylglycine-generating enzyme family protein [Candidatus Poribacteria bacterium]
MKKGIGFLSIIGLMLTILSACDKVSVSSEPPEDMVLIPAGEFIMGTDDPEAPPNENPAHQIYLDAFYIDKYEVTKQQYEEFMLAGGYQNQQLWTEEGWEFITKNEIVVPLGLGVRYFTPTENQPATGISWYEADAYARWAGKRLPTEAEWEKAARGNDGNTYPWGHEMDFTAVFYQFGRDPSPVGSYPTGASTFGAFDMAGNAWEWCSDWYNHYEMTSMPFQGSGYKTKKVIRGGSWHSGMLEMRSTYRDTNKPDYRNTTVGFRCARNAN